MAHKSSDNRPETASTVQGIPGRAETQATQEECGEGTRGGREYIRFYLREIRYQYDTVFRYIHCKFVRAVLPQTDTQETQEIK